MTEEQLVTENLGLVRFVSKKYKGNDEDIFQVGCIGLIKAARAFKPELGYAFSTYAVSKITGEIRRHLRDSNDNGFKLQREVKTNYLRWSAMNGNGYTDEEIAESIGITMEDLQFCISAMDHVASMDFVVSDGTQTRTVNDVVAADYDLENEVLRKIEHNEKMDLLRGMLKKTDYATLTLRLKAKSQQEIADMLGRSQVDVSRRLREIERVVDEMNSRYNAAV